VSQTTRRDDDVNHDICQARVFATQGAFIGR